MEGFRRRNLISHETILVKGNLPRTWREHTQREWNALLFIRYKTINVNNMVKYAPLLKKGVVSAE
jgi:hypothetical protein